MCSRSGYADADAYAYAHTHADTHTYAIADPKYHLLRCWTG